MKKNTVIVLVAVLILGICSTANAFPTLVTVDSVNDGGPSYTSGFSLAFDQGSYQFSVIRGAWNAWGSTNVQPGQPGWTSNDRGWMWRMNIYQPSTATYYTLGDIYPRYATEAEALAGHLGESIIINQPVNDVLWFYQSDSNVSDNIGAVTASVQQVSNSIPEPASMMLLGSGLLGLVGLRRKKV